MTSSDNGRNTLPRLVQKNRPGNEHFSDKASSAGYANGAGQLQVEKNHAGHSSNAALVQYSLNEIN
jgi:hypothetical protein